MSVSKRKIYHNMEWCTSQKTIDERYFHTLYKSYVFIFLPHMYWLESYFYLIYMMEISQSDRWYLMYVVSYLISHVDNVRMETMYDETQWMETIFDEAQWKTISHHFIFWNDMIWLKSNKIRYLMDISMSIYEIWSMSYHTLFHFDNVWIELETIRRKSVLLLWKIQHYQ